MKEPWPLAALLKTKGDDGVAGSEASKKARAKARTTLELTLADFDKEIAKQQKIIDKDVSLRDKKALGEQEKAAKELEKLQAERAEYQAMLDELGEMERGEIQGGEAKNPATTEVEDKARQDAEGSEVVPEQESSEQGGAAASVVGEQGGGSEGGVEVPVAEDAAEGSAKGKVKSAGVDSQGNPLNEDGTLRVEKIGSVEELTDEDFAAPKRTVELPDVPENVRTAIGAGDKPIIIKKNIFEKNRANHPELDSQQSRSILTDALYHPNKIGQTQPITRPNYWVAIRTADKNSVVVLEVNRNKDNVEIVGWRKIDAKGLEKMKRQVEREGGQFLIQTSEEAAAALSTLPSDSSFGGKGSEKSGDGQGEVEQKPLCRVNKQLQN